MVVHCIQLTPAIIAHSVLCSMSAHEPCCIEATKMLATDRNISAFVTQQ